MDRKTARANAMKLIYEWDMGGEGGEQTTLELLEAPIEPEDANFAYMNEVVDGVKGSVGELDGKISGYLRNWTLERISKVDLAILRIATWELMKGNIPAGIIINEAVELANTYSEDRAGSFVNGVLGNMSRAMNK